MADLSLSQVTDAQHAAIYASVIETLRQKAILYPTITDYSSQVKKGDVSLDILSASELEDSSPTSGEVVGDINHAGMSSQNLSLSAERILLNKHKGLTTTIHDRANFQSVADLKSEVLKAQTANMAQKIDNEIIEVLLAEAVNAGTASGSSVMGGVSALSLDDVLTGRTHFRNKNYDLNMDEFFMVIKPARERDLLALQEFKDAAAFGAQSVILSNQIGKIYGFNVIVHNSASLADNQVLMYHKSNVAFAVQAQMRFEEDRDIEKFADKYSVSMLYGLGTIRNGAGQFVFDGFTPAP